MAENKHEIKHDLLKKERPALAPVYIENSAQSPQSSFGLREILIESNKLPLFATKNNVLERVAKFEEVSRSLPGEQIKSPFFDESMNDMASVASAKTKASSEIVHLTVVDSVTTGSPMSPATPKTKFKKANGEEVEIILSTPNQWRAFGRRAVAYQRRQWVDNICCIT
jgi:hypothetical protein